MGRGQKDWRRRGYFFIYMDFIFTYTQAFKQNRKHFESEYA